MNFGGFFPQNVHFDSPSSPLQLGTKEYIKINSAKVYMLFSGNDMVSADINGNVITSENKNELLQSRTKYLEQNRIIQ